MATASSNATRRAMAIQSSQEKYKRYTTRIPVGEVQGLTEQRVREWLDAPIAFDGAGHDKKYCAALVNLLTSGITDGP